jgi:tellurite resistance protein
MSLFNTNDGKQQQNAVSVFSNMAPQQRFTVEKLADSYRYRDTGWTIPQAYLALLFLAASADGKFDVEEKAEIESIARRSPALRALLESGQLAPHEQGALMEIARDKDSALDKACATLSNDMVLSVFAHCVDLMLADGEFHDTERDFIDKLYPKLDISVDYARRILEVLLLKGRY